MDIERVLHRIGYDGTCVPSLALLATLQQQFLTHIPFENLDIHQQIPLDYSPQGVFDKLVKAGRGGLCYELNGLFYDLLTSLGYAVDFIAAEMFPGDALRGKTDHMALLVHWEGACYLVDVGNGKVFGQPLSIHNPTRVQGEDTLYTVGPYATDYLALFLEQDNAWQPRYAFKVTPQKRADFQSACHHTQTSADSIFTQKRLVTRPMPGGRKTLTDGVYLQTKDGQRQEKCIPTAQAYLHVLQNEFGITLPESAVADLF
ncbi:arylamine N-acetyltransferase family protein [Magnetococcus sp. PR-3]|uniref:arylamine N-acetyltransferase family protein n=1 Tax=Magnetococcus sp. PR-3 TaxID=3120355 RepID=UPI002FCE035D